MPSHDLPAKENAPRIAHASALSLRGWLAVFALALAVYALTANRGVQWQDSGSHILRAVTGDLYGSRGLALVHPLHHWLARCAVVLNLWEPCLAITLISSVAAAVAVANTFGCVLTLTGCRKAALFAACSLGVAHTFWQMATLTETYTLAAALLSAECWCLAIYSMTRRRGALWSALLFNGLGVANHLLAGLTTPVLFFVVAYSMRKRCFGWKNAVVAVVLWVLGSLPYSGLVLVSMFRSGEIVGTIRSALFGHSYADEVLNTSVSARLVLFALGFILLSFPNMLMPAAVHGLVRGHRSSLPAMVRRAFAAGLLTHVLFIARYNIVDQHTFFVPAYVLCAIFGGIGFALVERQARTRVRTIFVTAATITLIVTPVLYAFVPGVARHFGVLRDVQRNKPYRDDYQYIFSPWSRFEQSAERMSREAVELAGISGLIIVEDAMAGFAVRYRALRDGRENIQILKDISDLSLAEAVRAGKTIVVVPLRRDRPKTQIPERGGAWRREGDLWVFDAVAAHR